MNIKNLFNLTQTQCELITLFESDAEGEYRMRNVTTTRPMSDFTDQLVAHGLIELVSLDRDTYLAEYRLTEIGKRAYPLILAADYEAPETDDGALRLFSRRMDDKLCKKTAEGFGGWRNCSQEDLTRRLREHVEKGDPVDVANFCMMLSALGMSIGPAPQKPIADEWIACSESLPECEQAVLILFKDGRCEGGALFYENPIPPEETFQPYRYWDSPDNDGLDWDFKNVTHWHTLPPPPLVTATPQIGDTSHDH